MRCCGRPTPPRRDFPPYGNEDYSSLMRIRLVVAVNHTAKDGALLCQASGDAMKMRYAVIALDMSTPSAPSPRRRLRAPIIDAPVASRRVG
jgi:hypothetical protein